MSAVLCPYQRGELWGWQCSHTGAELHTHMLMQAHGALGLATQHHPGQPHWPCLLRHASPETAEYRLKHTQPGGEIRKKVEDEKGKKREEIKRRIKDPECAFRVSAYHTVCYISCLF